MTHMMKIQAQLTKKIEYRNLEGKRVIHPVGTSIVVDIEKNIAACGGEHFDIMEEEFQELYVN